MSRNAHCKGERFTEFAAIGLVVFDLNKFITIFSFSWLLTLRPHRYERREENTERELSFTLPRIQTVFTPAAF